MKAIIAAIVLALFAWVLVSLFANPMTTVRLRNNTSMSLSQSCLGANPNVAPGREVTIPMGVLNPYPCQVYAAKVDGARHIFEWVGCLHFDPLTDHESQISQAIAHVTFWQCIKSSPR